MSRVSLSWNAWRDVDDLLRIAEDGMCAASSSRGHGEQDDAMTGEGGAPSELRGWGMSVGAIVRRGMRSTMFGASREDLLYASGGLNSADPTGQFGADSTVEWDKGTLDEGFTPPTLPKYGAVEVVTLNRKNGYSNLPGDPHASTAHTTFDSLNTDSDYDQLEKDCVHDPCTAFDARCAQVLSRLEKPPTPTAVCAQPDCCGFPLPLKRVHLFH